MSFFLADLPNVIKYMQTLPAIEVYKITVALFFSTFCIIMAVSEYKVKKEKLKPDVNDQDLADRWG